MHDNDFLNMANAWHLAQEFMPTNFTLKFIADRTDTTAKSLIELSDQHFGFSREVEAALVHELRDAMRQFVQDAMQARGPTSLLTATGVDEQTDVEQIARWGLDDLELGFLYSARQAGVAKRYPSWDWIAENAAKYPRCSLHICGSPARKALLNKELDVSNFQRIQINGDVRPGSAARLSAYFPRHKIILQFQGRGDEWMLGLDWANLQVLVDASGGNGLLPKFWPRLETKLSVGFAGGLNADNMEAEVRKIRAVADLGWWVDLESWLRRDEWFSREILEWVHRAYRKGLTKLPVCQACGNGHRMLEHTPGEWVCHGTHVEDPILSELPYPIVR